MQELVIVYPPSVGVRRPTQLAMNAKINSNELASPHI